MPPASASGILNAVPGRKGYLIAAAIFVVGVIVFAGFLFLRLRGLTESFTQVVVPGSSEIAIEDPGRFTIYRESGGAVGGVIYGDSDLTGLRIVILAPEGREVDLRPAGASETYTLGGRSGVAIFHFDAPAAGTYRVEADYEPGRERDAGVLAVGKGFTPRLLVTVFAAIGILGLAMLSSLAIAITTFVKRYRARRR